MPITSRQPGRSHPFESLLAFPAALIGRALGRAAARRAEKELDRLPRYLRDDIGLETHGTEGTDPRLMEMAIRISGYRS